MHYCGPSYGPLQPIVGLLQVLQSLAKATGRCGSCDVKSIVQRTARKDSTPRIYYGNIASGNEVMKHGITRDGTARGEGVICFETEASSEKLRYMYIVVRMRSLAVKLLPSKALDVCNKTSEPRSVLAMWLNSNSGSAQGGSRFR
jgi:hypothetical protein